ncbi:RING/U-box protein with C6HC-type zinc finger [Arabidopsis thaliana]|uniref:E3 ubiquitin-protein ligase RSL1 n=1 Tax=Arabidopsis thaliana TaxID=3702 RepID=RGSL1_ARATH|nr:RING/U-box protein with C6HC-type zinc finger [Arabidopsis thaliana]F4ITM1.1 RecName: Full=E3 ubiquitin-protein ligase RSL1; AltName: Full=Protein RING FINGER OF SEED LONGEVITY 1; AltName: Full=RING-type E3 ubiquitin transferase RSL1 [Arabidopsis thaliana]AEC07797.1 RING/U-box protein with C6HC-type zinc finger [Arabidopsis thaliana]|eukprot:NP_180182.2 RING/U-box protein with C6HC-type zinc finger [Arabidopsis thaliana]
MEEDDLNPAGKPLYRLYFKGLVTEEKEMLLAGFGVAICGDKDDLLFDLKVSIHDPTITLLEVELIALKSGLNQAVSLGINHISICCDHEYIFELVMGISTPKQESIALLLRDVQGIRKYLTSSIPVMLTQNQSNLAYDFAIEAISSEIIIDIPAQKETCNICLNDDINADQMFSVDKSGHMCCSECVKRHIEVRLLEGSLITCPHYRCNSLLTSVRCGNLLTPKLNKMWEQKTKDELIPVMDRVYCPNPRCSTLMSETELSGLNIGVRRCCVKCGEPFCVKCKVSWHNNLSCDEYKTLHPNPTENDGRLRDLANEKSWRQCSKCKHMIELSSGCISVVCRCGHTFCYQCGADAGDCFHGLGRDDLDLTQCCGSCCCFVFFLVIIAIVVTIILLVRRFS